MSRKAMLFLVLAFLVAAPAAIAGRTGNIPDPPLTARLSVNDSAGQNPVKMMLFARSATDMPVPGVKIYMKIHTTGKIAFHFNWKRQPGPNETFKVSKDGKLMTWSMFSAPPNTGMPARLPIELFFSELKDNQAISVTVWGYTVEGSKPTEAQTRIWGVA